MSIARTHELHKRRLGRNLGLGAVLVAFVAIVFGMTVVKVSRGEYVDTPAQTELRNGN